MIRYDIYNSLVLRRFIIGLISLGFFPDCAWAETQLGNFQDWGAFMAKENSKPVCYIVAEPVTSQGKYKKRGQTFFGSYAPSKRGQQKKPV